MHKATVGLNFVDTFKILCIIIGNDCKSKNYDDYDVERECIHNMVYMIYLMYSIEEQQLRHDGLVWAQCFGASV